ncbi:MAG TPA: cytochrome c oxidase subunit II [Gemmatimonadales bacterium]
MNYFRTFGPISDRLATLGWVLIIISLAVVLVVSVLVLVGVLRRGTHSFAPVARTGGGLRWIVIGGILVPVVILAAVFVFSIATQSAVASPATRPELTVRVTGRQWWWEVQYLDQSPGRIVATTANEVHVPVGRPVKLEVVAADVIHSFWVPELAGKTDLIPGQRNVAWIQADHPGVYRGQCAEYCGLQHAKMALLVVAQPPGEFQEWLARQGRPAVPPANADTRAGEAVFTSSACALCHTIRGTTAAGVLGPDLTHLADRRAIAAGTLPNTRGSLAGWIADPQRIKPGNLMPVVPLDGSQLQVLVAYLQSLE